MKEKDINNLEFVQMANNDLPVFKEDRFKNWIKYGENNNYPNQLIDLAGKSALHNAIISGKVDALKGKGLQYEGEESDIKTDSFLKNANPYETLDDVYMKAAWDLTVFGGYALEIIISRDKKTIAQVNHLDFSKIRCGVKNESNQIDTFYFSNDWNQYRKAEYAPEAIPAYSPESKETRQLLYFKEYRPGTEYYPLPSYIGAIAYIEIDTEIANFHLSNIKNGMAPSLMITFPNGTPPAAERKEIMRKLKDSRTGSNTAGKIMLNFSDSKDTAPIVETIQPSQLDKQFTQLSEVVLQNILSGHKVTSPLLVGIKTEGQLGGNNELVTAFQIFDAQVISPMKEQLLSSFNKIMERNGMQELSIETTAPVEFTYSESVLTQILTKDELREKIGEDPLQEEGATFAQTDIKDLKENLDIVYKQGKSKE